MRIQSYDLCLDVDFERARVSGRVGLRVEGAGPEIVLDSVGLDIRGARVDGAMARFSLDRTAGTLKIPTGPSTSLVEIEYGKDVPDEVIFGLYKSRFGPDYFLVTDLEPAEARKVFPCKDDPAYKAVFNLEVVTEKGLTVVSNSGVKSRTETEDGRMLHVFRPTPVMSTYLFFLGIGRFDEAKRRSAGVDVVVAARPNQTARGKFILDVASAVLRDYSRYFDVPYPLKKLHLIALPEYHTGAMENWGAITSREAYVLVDENSGAGPLKRAALVIIHEIAHQWFGDLVTMKWWNDLWLNESFATFMEYKMLDRLRPKWDVWADFLRVDTFRSMNQDALPSTHPIEVDVRTPSEVGQVFDAISYGKGANVIRMIESHIGEEAFRRGVSAYLKDFSYANARGRDLWEHLEQASGQPVSKIMGTWVRNDGFPVIRVRTGSENLMLSQKRFSLNGGQHRSDELWPIPVTMRVDGNRMGFVMDKKTASVRVPEASDLLINPDHAGFYSVLYDAPGYGRLAEGFASLDPHDKGGLMNDLFLFLQAGEVEPALYFKFVRLCGDVGDHLVVQTVSDQLSYLNSIAGDARSVAEHRLRFLTSQMQRLGLSPAPGEDDSRKDDRETVASELATADPGFAEKLARRFDNYASVEPDMKVAVAIAYVMATGKAAYGPLSEMVKHEDAEEERSRLYRALTSFKDPRCVIKTMDLAIGGEVSRSDTGYTLTYAALNPHARDALWDWIVQRFERLWEIYGGSQQVFIYLDAMVPRCGLGREKEVRVFLNRRMKENGGVTFKRTLERLRVNSRLRSKLLSGS